MDQQIRLTSDQVSAAPTPEEVEEQTPYHVDPEELKDWISFDTYTH